MQPGKTRLREFSILGVALFWNCLVRAEPKIKADKTSENDPKKRPQNCPQKPNSQVARNPVIAGNLSKQKGALFIHHVLRRLISVRSPHDPPLWRRVFLWTA